MFDSTAFRVVIGEDSTLRWTGFYVQPSLSRIFFLFYLPSARIWGILFCFTVCYRLADTPCRWLADTLSASHL